ncbi:MAG: carboxypeptidase regulatory-like domain-containing protein [Chloroflexi bacterium]|nr:carboxypeptidase regulatory-like domain-containing protein [Chloroflexota bacterium]
MPHQRKRTWFWVLSFVFAFSLSWTLVACTSTPPLLRGTVLDASDGRPIAGARLQITAPSTMQSWELTADKKGNYQVSLDSGAFSLVASAPGYVTATFDILLGKDTLAQERDIHLSRRRLNGIVRDAATGQPMGGVLIVCGSEEQRTRHDGTFALDLPEGEPLSLSAKGYLSTTLADDQIAAILDDDGQQAQPITLTLQPRTIAGVVLEKGSRQPLEGVVVSAGEQEVRSDARGAFRLGPIEPGTPIRVLSADHRPLPEILFAGQERLEIELEPWRTRLLVSDERNNLPLAAAAIVANDALLAETGQEGTAEIEARLGTRLHVQKPGYRGRTLNYEGERELRVALQPSQLSGVVREVETGQPISRALVLAFAVADPLATKGFEPISPITMTYTDDTGRFVFPDALDVASLLVKAPRYARLIQPIAQVGEVELELQPFQAHGLYIPFGVLTLPERITELLDLVEGSMLNSVVVDVKGDRSRIAWDSPLPLAKELEAYQRDVMDLREFLRTCHERGIYAIARMVVFKDDLLATHHPEWAVAREEGGLYEDLEGLHWVDPFRAEVRAYNIALAREVAALGFDEIQLDYLRFPSDGRIKGLVYSQEATFESRTAAMAEFCAQMAEAIRPTPAFLSADIFGLTVWVDPGRDMGIGQRVDDIAPHMDYLSPMLYPITFGPGNLGFDRPGLYPYEVVYYSVLTTKERTSTPVRPWLQHYTIFGIEYDLQRLLLQRRAAEDAGADGWIYWNSRGRYDPEVFTEGASARVQPPPLPEENRLPPPGS